MTPEQKLARIQRKFMATLGISARTEAVWRGMSLQATTAGDNEVMVYGPVVDDLEAECFNEMTEYDTMTTANLVRARLNEIEGDVVVRVNSPGGNVWDGAAIHAALVERRQAGDKVTVRIDGLAASVASLIMLAGDRIEIAELGKLMIHRAWAFTAGNADELRKDADILEKTDQSQSEMYAARMGEGVDVMKLLKAETWYTATEAVAAGLADGKIEVKNKPAKKAATNAARNARFRAMLALEAT